MMNSIAETLGKTRPFYQETGKEEAVFTHAFHNQIPVLLKGPTGTGKSRFVEYMAAVLGRPLITVSCHEETSSTDLIGRYIVKGAETVWIDGPLVSAVKTGAILYLDEMAEARPDVIVAIHPLTDHRRQLYIDKLGETVCAGSDFMLVASFNPGYQRGYKELKPSTRQRFAGISFRYPDADTEKNILIRETGVDADVATRLVKIGGKIRNLRELGLAETASTRLLVDAARLIRSGLPKRLSVRTAIIEPLTDDDETIAALCDVADLMI
ncbi:CbbQ/NirQ/NorQ/GpvN family protein [Chitinophaga sp.]|uniref:CbbQ/NirQ/NorQ/GpvN family protein n=1 Tax=Chitinophaga sp. TaxID=1869181 RepID=UPI00262D4893|nr:CbbQ/NirQ/NorQ/GpvN family protein [uncultured Chitinophaga sp.]